jgi:hypothetical protein
MAFHPPQACCPRPRAQVSLCQGPLQGQRRSEEKPRQPPVGLPAQTPEPTHRYKPREVRRQGDPRWTRCPSRRVVVSLVAGQPAQTAFGPRVGRRLSIPVMVPLTPAREPPPAAGDDCSGRPRGGGDGAGRRAPARAKPIPESFSRRRDFVARAPSSRTFVQTGSTPPPSRIDDDSDRCLRNSPE